MLCLLVVVVMMVVVLVSVVKIEYDSSGVHKGTVEAKIELLAHDNRNLRKDVREVWSTFSILLQEANSRLSEVFSNADRHTTDEVESSIAQCSDRCITQELAVNADKEVQCLSLYTIWILDTDLKDLLGCWVLLSFWSVRILFCEELEHVGYGRSTEHSLEDDMVVTGLLSDEVVELPLQIARRSKVNMSTFSWNDVITKTVTERCRIEHSSS